MDDKIFVGKLYNVGSSRKSLACVLPKRLCKALGLSAGVHVVKVSDSGILLTPINLESEIGDLSFIARKTE